MKHIVSNKKIYYALQFTWGLLANIVGGIVFLFLKTLYKKKAKKFYNNFYIEVDKPMNFSIGIFFVVSSNARMSTKLHESGHSLQNVVWGPLFLFVIAIPSFIRYWYRASTPNKKHPDYYSIWFEGQASRWGEEYILTYGKKED